MSVNKLAALPPLRTLLLLAPATQSLLFLMMIVFLNEDGSKSWKNLLRHPTHSAR
jgi:hypothetical protein